MEKPNHTCLVCNGNGVLYNWNQTGDHDKYIDCPHCPCSESSLAMLVMKLFIYLIVVIGILYLLLSPDMSRKKQKQKEEIERIKTELVEKPLTYMDESTGVMYWKRTMTPVYLADGSIFIIKDEERFSFQKKQDAFIEKMNQ